MRLNLIPLLMALCCAVPALARDFDYYYQGRKITYTVLDETARTVQTKSGIGSWQSGNNVSGNLVLPSHPYDGNVEYTLIAIGDYAFRGLTSIEIPNSVITIGAYAFYGCSSMTSVVIPNSVTTIGQYAFYNCRGLTSIKIPNSVTTIGAYAFYGCSSMTSVVIPNSVTTIGQYAFCSCSGLTSVELPNSITTIGASAFSGCQNLKKVVIPNSVTTIEEHTFYSCRNMTSLVIPNTVTTIGQYAFWGCENLRSLEIPNSVTTIDYQSFSNCGGITDLVIPSSVTTIGREAFYYCWGLKNVKISNSVNFIGRRAFFCCNVLTSVDIPASATTIENGAFSACSSLSEINVDAENPNYSSVNGVLFNKDGSTLVQCGGATSAYSVPSSVTTIADEAFYRCKNLTSVEIPKSVAAIGNSAFEDCSGLRKVTSLSKEPPTLGQSAFANMPSLYIPHGTLAAYQGSDWAQYFSSMEELPSNLTLGIVGNGRIYHNSFDEVANGTEFEGSDFTFFVLPDDGNYIAAITLEGVDITSNLVNHRLTISDFKGEGDGVLKVEFLPENEATLTIKGADTHVVRHTYKEGTSARIELCPEEGWVIHSVTYNGEEVTEQLVGNVFDTEPLHGENTMNVVFVSGTPSGVDEPGSADTQAQISVTDNTVTISGLNPEEMVKVYDLSGRTVYAGPDRVLTLEPGNAYILHTSSKTFKVTL